MCSNLHYRSLTRNPTINPKENPIALTVVVFEVLRISFSVICLGTGGVHDKLRKSFYVKPMRIGLELEAK